MSRDEGSAVYQVLNPEWRRERRKPHSCLPVEKLKTEGSREGEKEINAGQAYTVCQALPHTVFLFILVTML